ncbi:protein Largen [Entelurus aequoreus]|uniref:protein Largen n=1 Tax=Entelurus aequoreus TaxID=161455 RepID=UPI002B1CE2EA|nr:protein Largen [Entelurus aequoreus]XP_061881530.1 protein Largen [Entelurus aequoreus]
MSGTADADGVEGAVSKVQVKREIKTIVENLETILGDLKDVAKELKEVVHDIDTLTCDLQLEEDGLTDSSKTDTLNSSSSSTATTTTTASSLEKIRLFTDDCLFKPVPLPAINSGVLTVHKKAHPPLPPPRLTSVRVEDHNGRSLPHPTLVLSGNLSKANGSLLKNGGVFPLKPNRELFSPTSCFITNDGGIPESGLVPTLPRPMPLLRHEQNKCPKARSREPRERVRFSEKVQYHGYCPDCDLQYDVDDSELHLQAELNDMRLSPVHCCSSSCSPLPHELQNGGLSVCHSYPPKANTPSPPPLPCVPPHSASLKPQKTILRKSTSTTV